MFAGIHNLLFTFTGRRVEKHHCYLYLCYNSFTFPCQASFLLCQASIRRMVFDVVSQSVMERTAISPFLVNKNFQYSAFASNAHFNFKIEEENIYLFNDLE